MARLSLIFAACGAACAAVPFEAVKSGRELRLSADLPPSATRAELRISSARNRAIPKFTGVSPLNAEPTPPRQTRDAETWYPVVDVKLEAGMEGVA